jgi:catechol 2,3-dioxygenase-like lactoylglutathione lyase family enzyme
MLRDMKTDASEVDLNEIGQIAITISDLEKAVAFYRDILGLRHLFSAPPGLAFFAAGNLRLMLSRPEKEGSETFCCALYFKVPEIEKTHGVLVSRGVRFEAEPHRVAKMPDHELWMAFFRDPDRNLLALMCEKRG